MICVPVVASTMEQAEDQFDRLQVSPCDLIELRVDFFKTTPDLRTLIHRSPRPVIVTCRPPREGGYWPHTEDHRIALLQKAVGLGAAYVDVEADSIHRIRRESATRLIASYHNFRETPADLNRIVEDLERLPCDIVKFATMATNLSDNLRVFDCLATCTKPAIGLCMGELGECSRILALQRGAILTFGSLTSGNESAPGQLPADDLHRLYRVKELGQNTELYGVVGDPIAHSMSPAIHNTAFHSIGRDAVYLRFRVNDFEPFLSTVASTLGLRGLSVTIPHKASALAASQHIAPLAASIGSVNTMTQTETGWQGDNTDCAAALDAIREAGQRIDVTLEGQSALVLGAGGTARAIAFGLKDAGCLLTIANRTRARAERLAADVGAHVVDLEQAHSVPCSIVANTTSVGMHPHEDATPIHADVFHSGAIAFDAVYNPQETRFLREAKSRGAQIASGLDMFIGQAVRQFEIWTRQSAPKPVMERVVRQRLQALA